MTSRLLVAVTLSTLALSCRPSSASGVSLPNVTAEPETPAVAAPPAALVEDARTVVQHGAAVRWTTVASLLVDGTESCIDGRSEGPVLGTPGGDAGELLAGIAALENVAKQPVDLPQLDGLFDEYAASFGRLYMHTDHHAMERLEGAIHADPRLHDFEAPSDLHALAERILTADARHRPALLELLTRPEHIGCAHLRSALSEPATYGTRAELVRGVIASAFRLGWRNRGGLDWEMLEGDHREKGILEVRFDTPVHAHSRVPMIAPHDATKEFFVHHPDVASYVRRENGSFFLEHGRQLVSQPPSEEAYLRELDAVAARQARATVAKVAKGLPVVHVVVHDGALSVLGGDASQVDAVDLVALRHGH